MPLPPTKPDQIRQGITISGLFIPEAMEVLHVIPFVLSLKVIGRGTKTGQSYDSVLSPDQIAQLKVTGEAEPFDGSAQHFRIGIEANRLGLAYEYDPYFSLSIARVDPLPHQLEAVYGYFLKLPRIRFLLADDPGAGKTIMAGLLLKELKARGLVQRTLIVTPANLSFQWQREMKDKFRENFEVIRSDVLRANYGQNPWQDRDQVVTSISWVSRVEDARDSLLRSRWDLVIVDEAHKMAAYAGDKKTLAYQLGEKLSEMTDHFLLMTATPHKGDPENFCLFLSLLDKDVYGNIKSLQEAMRRNKAPFYLRRTKEALVSFPDPETGMSQAEQHLDELNNRLEARRKELDQERHCTIGDITHIGRAMVLPHPDRQTPQIAPMVRDEEVEKIAVKVATEHEEARGFVVESVEADNRGFDLISRKPHPEDPKTFIEVRFIEVKGRAGVGEIFLSANEYKAAERLKADYWLYAVFNCGSTPELNTIRDPFRLDWLPVTKVEQYKVKPGAVRGQAAP